MKIYEIVINSRVFDWDKMRKEYLFYFMFIINLIICCILCWNCKWILFFVRDDWNILFLKDKLKLFLWDKLEYLIKKKFMNVRKYIVYLLGFIDNIRMKCVMYVL